MDSMAPDQHLASDSIPRLAAGPVQRRYLLTRDVHLHLASDAAVFLDTSRDKYTGLGAADVPKLRALLEGTDNIDSESTKRLAEQLLAADILTLDASRGKNVESTPIQPAREQLLDLNLHDASLPAAAEIATFARAYVTARWLLKRQCFARILERVRVRRLRSAGMPVRRDQHQLRKLVSSFFDLRPLLYVARDQCLLDSFVLLEFLSHYNVYPTWVFGVATRPFMAHCWIQDDRFVFNNSPAFVSGYAPIMAV